MTCDIDGQLEFDRFILSSCDENIKVDDKKTGDIFFLIETDKCSIDEKIEPTNDDEANKLVWECFIVPTVSRMIAEKEFKVEDISNARHYLGMHAILDNHNIKLILRADRKGRGFKMNRFVFEIEYKGEKEKHYENISILKLFEVLDDTLTNLSMR